jgi:hypothetical protein
MYDGDPLVYRARFRSLAGACSAVAEGFGAALLYGAIGGLGSLAVDLDHILVLVAKGIPITWENLATQAGRPLHFPMFLVWLALFSVAATHFARFYLAYRVIR